MYSVEFTARARRNLNKLDHQAAVKVVDWIDKNLNGCSDPRRFGKALVANRRGQWRYRVGDYRIIAEIEDRKLLIMIVDTGHRRSIYD